MYASGATGITFTLALRPLFFIALRGKIGRVWMPTVGFGMAFVLLGYFVVMLRAAHRVGRTGLIVAVVIVTVANAAVWTWAQQRWPALMSWLFG
jgi:hypothetical protein